MNTKNEIATDNFRLKDIKGILIAITIICLWFLNLSIAILWQLNWLSPITYLLFFLQIHLFTGLFITAHDAMHGTVSRNPRINKAIGQFCTFLYAFFPYDSLLEKHHKHHRHVATAEDPDYAEGSFLKWYFSFVTNYVTILQFLGYAISFNILKLFLPTENLIFYWIIPAILSTLQLFYFGTYLPHRGEHEEENVHKARSQKKNHLWAFVSCYFFGYHYEHHDKPYLPWWKLYQYKE